MSDSLRSLRTNEQIANFSLSLTKNERFAQKNSKKIVFFVRFLQVFLKFFKKSNDLLVPFEQSERFTQVAQKE